MYLCFIDYTKTFHKINHAKLETVMKRANIPEDETRLTENLYWNQEALLRTRIGVRQGCNLSRILFNFYSEFLIQEALQASIKICLFSITSIRYCPVSRK